MIRHLLVSMLSLTLCGAAWAQDLDDEEAESTISGTKRASSISQDVPEPQSVVRAQSNQPYSSRAYEGARVLNMDVAFVQDCINATDLLFQRDYAGAKKAFEDAGRRWPHSGLGPVGQVLVYQAMMLENMDLKYEAQYEHAAKRAKQQLQQAMEVPGNDAWEAFIFGGVLGVDAIHSMRKGNYLTSLNRGLDAMKSVNRAKKLAPEFKDPLLGDGLYNYWRTVITNSVRGLPSFEDKRKVGIQQMQQVEQEGIFLGPAATFALTYTWLEENAKKRALRAAMRNQKRYPDNIVNNILVGRIHMYRRQYAASERYFMKVLKAAPENQKVHYYLGRLYIRTKMLARAEKHLDTYLGYEMPKEAQAYALYSKGLIYYRRKDFDAAEKYVNEAWETGKLKRAKKRLEKIHRHREKVGQ